MRALSPNTLRAYRSDIELFQAWLDRDWRTATSTDVVEFIKRERDLVSTSTISRRLAAIRRMFHVEGLPSPTHDPAVIQALEETPDQPTERPNGLTYLEMCTVVDAIPDDLRGSRDAALLLVGWWGHLERMTLARLQCDDVIPENGNRWVIRLRSHHRQTGRRWGVRDNELDLIEAVRVWKDRSGIKTGPLFRPIDRWDRLRDRHLSGEAVSLIVKDRTGVLARGWYAGNTLKYGPLDEENE